jgi:tRNA (adenine22-N1)-methyltransferase
MKSIKLSNRLGAAAAFIGRSAGVADVGTDHGCLPVWLAQNGLSQRIVATDINKGPLERALTTASEYGVADRIEFMLTDGLVGVDNTGLDTVVIAGMGGETIISILDKAEWVHKTGVRLILQPQTKLALLACWLRDAGFRLRDAVLAEDDGRLYVILLTGWEEEGDFIDPIRLLADKRDVLLPMYLEREIIKTHRAVQGMKEASGNADTFRLKEQQLSLLMEIREETDRWQR